VGEEHREGEDGDVVEVVADFADDLAGPHVAVVAVAAQELEEFAHQAGRLETRRGELAGLRIRMREVISFRVSKGGMDE
jgi:hypothetical protein